MLRAIVEGKEEQGCIVEGLREKVDGLPESYDHPVSAQSSSSITLLSFLDAFAYRIAICR